MSLALDKVRLGSRPVRPRRPLREGRGRSPGSFHRYSLGGSRPGRSSRRSGFASAIPRFTQFERDRGRHRGIEIEPDEDSSGSENPLYAGRTFFRNLDQVAVSDHSRLVHTENDPVNRFLRAEHEVRQVRQIERRRAGDRCFKPAPGFHPRRRRRDDPLAQVRARAEFSPGPEIFRVDSFGLGNRAELPERDDSPGRIAPGAAPFPWALWPSCRSARPVLGLDRRRALEHKASNDSVHSSNLDELGGPIPGNSELSPSADLRQRQPGSKNDPPKNEISGVIDDAEVFFPIRQVDPFVYRGEKDSPGKRGTSGKPPVNPNTLRMGSLLLLKVGEIPETHDPPFGSRGRFFRLRLLRRPKRADHGCDNQEPPQGSCERRHRLPPTEKKARAFLGKGNHSVSPHTSPAPDPAIAKSLPLETVPASPISTRRAKTSTEIGPGNRVD